MTGGDQSQLTSCDCLSGQKKPQLITGKGLKHMQLQLMVWLLAVRLGSVTSYFPVRVTGPQNTTELPNFLWEIPPQK